MEPKRNNLNNWKPGASKNTLLFIAGLMWIIVGLMLDGLSVSWLRLETLHDAILAAAIGFVCSLVIHHFGFLRIVDRNLARILPMEGQRCVFAFMPWKSYLLIFIMVAMGYVLRHSSISKLYVAVLYSAIGTALILGSVRYLRYLILSMKGKLDRGRSVL